MAQARSGADVRGASGLRQSRAEGRGARGGGRAVGGGWRCGRDLRGDRRERGWSKEESELLDEYIREFEARDDGQKYSDQ